MSFVAEGFGLDLVPQSLREMGVAEVVFRDLEEAPTIEHVVVWQPGNLNPALRPFLSEAGIVPRQ